MLIPPVNASASAIPVPEMGVSASVKQSYATPQGLMKVRAALSQIATLVLESDLRAASYGVGRGAAGSESLASLSFPTGPEAPTQGELTLDESMRELINEVFAEGTDGGIEARVDAVAAATRNRQKIAGDALANLKASESKAREVAAVARGEATVDGGVRPRVDHPSRLALANALGVMAEDLEDVVVQVEAAFGDGIWNLLILSGRTELALESKAIRSSRWDHLEALAVSKLVTLVERGAVKNASELLAIAATANRATRHSPNGDNAERGGASQTQGGITMNIFGGGNVPKGDLPGAGDLGTIQLSLSSRVKRQLAAPKSDEARVLQDSKMLNAEDLRGLVRRQVESPLEVVDVDPLTGEPIGRVEE